jgi:hypothetical protein
MADDVMRAPAPVPPVELSQETRGLLVELADKLDALRPNTDMSEGIRLGQALVLAEQLHGPTEAAYAAEQDFLAALPHVRDEQTRGEYAAQLRLIAQGVTP